MSQDQKVTWSDLNKRQQAFLQAVYDQDQENERDEKGGWLRGAHSRPAREWRWMHYGVTPLARLDSPLKARLRYARLDRGTVSVFEAFEQRGLILLQYRDAQIYVQITPTGRRLVRAATGQQREKPLPPGTLREWHWKALVLAWQSRPEGVKKEDTGYYGRVSWNTWLRLRDYKISSRERPLVEEYHIYRSTNHKTGTTYYDYFIRLTAFGEQYYRENWSRYRDLYPDIDAPEPVTEDEKE